MTQIRDPELVCPVIGGNRQPDGSFHFNKVFGTAFSIGGQTLFMTAGHSIETAKSEGTMVLGFPHANGLAMCKVADSEVFSQYDVGIIRVTKPIQSIKAASWREGTNRNRDEVTAIGFPHAYDPNEPSITYRGFMGHIVSTYKYSRLPGNPLCHELSFQAPRGLSGAPLLLLRAPLPIVAGIVVANRSTEMEVYRDTEVIDDGKLRETLIRFEAIQFGIAIDAADLLDQGSRILGSTLREHLRQHALLWQS